MSCSIPSGASRGAKWRTILVGAALALAACSEAEGPSAAASSSGGNSSTTSGAGGGNTSTTSGAGGGSTSTTSGGSAGLGPVGAPCSTGATEFINFRGYEPNAVEMGSQSPSCASTICLVNHFQGLPSCPYGQSQQELDTLPGDSPELCRADGGELVPFPVKPQLLERRAEDTIHCSCRCDGADAEDVYCDCPSGFECSLLVSPLGLGDTDLGGSYCIKAGTLYEPGGVEIPTCQRELGNCE